jgi:hypothetical protein
MKPGFGVGGSWRNLKERTALLHQLAHILFAYVTRAVRAPILWCAGQIAHRWVVLDTANLIFCVVENFDPRGGWFPQLDASILI